jgi:hypothetical protein
MLFVTCGLSLAYGVLESSYKYCIVTSHFILLKKWVFELQIDQKCFKLYDCSYYHRKYMCIST